MPKKSNSRDENSSTVDVASIVGDFAEDKDAAATIREDILRPALKNGNAVVLNFAGVSLATQSFVHALISDLLRSEGEPVLERIEFRTCTPGVRGIIETVVQYSLDTMDGGNVVDD